MYSLLDGKNTTTHSYRVWESLADRWATVWRRIPRRERSRSHKNEALWWSYDDQSRSKDVRQAPGQHFWQYDTRQDTDGGGAVENDQNDHDYLCRHLSNTKIQQLTHYTNSIIHFKIPLSRTSNFLHPFYPLISTYLVNFHSAFSFPARSNFCSDAKKG